MGFSVSGSAVLVFVGVLISFGMFSAAASNGFERVSDARSAAREDALDRQNTAINVTGATYDSVADELTVRVDNAGATALDVNDTDVLVDNDLQGSFVSRTVDGSAGTGVWLPGETLEVVVSLSSAPDRVKVVTGPGVAGTEAV